MIYVRKHQAKKADAVSGLSFLFRCMLAASSLPAVPLYRCHSSLHVDWQPGWECTIKAVSRTFSTHSPLDASPCWHTSLLVAWSLTRPFKRHTGTRKDRIKGGPVLQPGRMLISHFKPLQNLPLSSVTQMKESLCLTSLLKSSKWATRYHAILCSCPRTLFIYVSCPRARISDCFRATQNEM